MCINIGTCIHSRLFFFQVVLNNDSAEFLLQTNGTFTVTPEFIGSRLLLKMKKMAEQYLGVHIDKAVISVPAEFDERQRNYTIRAAGLAGQSAADHFSLRHDQDLMIRTYQPSKTVCAETCLKS